MNNYNGMWSPNYFNPYNQDDQMDPQMQGFDQGAFNDFMMQQQMMQQQMTPQADNQFGEMPMQIPERFGTGYSDQLTGQLPQFTQGQQFPQNQQFSQYEQPSLPDFPTSMEGFGLGATAPKIGPSRNSRRAMMNNLLNSI